MIRRKLHTSELSIVQLQDERQAQGTSAPYHVARMSLFDRRVLSLACGHEPSGIHYHFKFLFFLFQNPFICKRCKVQLHKEAPFVVDGFI